MKRSSWLALLVTLLLAAPVPRALAAETNAMDAAWWNGLSENGKVVAIEATINALTQGFADGILHASKATKYKQDSVILSISTPTFNHTFGYYEDMVTDFYTTHPNKATLDIASVLLCIEANQVERCGQGNSVP